ncbi:MAG: hypothetical protein IE931_01575 [Sphingobacteriales bacterium]|nr:hypothetical protein [Sphingobacteriales bacterium]
MSKMFSALRLKSGFQKMKRELKKLNRKKHSVSFTQAKNIGILLTIRNQKEFEEAEHLAKGFQHEDKQVKVMIYIADKTLKVNPNTHIEVLYEEDMSWNFIPQKEKIVQFVNHEFDLLLNLCTEVCFPLTYISALSKSLFKVGAYFPKQTAIFDFMLATEEQSITGFSTELRYYLDKIK